MSYLVLKRLFEEYSLLGDISGILNWDMATYMPLKSRKQRVLQIQKLYDYKKKIIEEIKKKELFEKIDRNSLNQIDKLNFDLMKNKFEYLDIIPDKLIKKKINFSIECEGLWRDAKKKSNFSIVRSSFVKLINLVKEESEILSQKKNKKRYDCLLLNYDRSLDTESLIKIFNRVERFIKKVLPLIKVSQKSKKDFKENLTENDQFALSKIFMKQLSFDFSRGRIDKSSHPFCGGSTNDIRITTRFTDDDPFSCFDALMHETGHALYEQGLPKEWMHQPVGRAGGMSLHESQSLFIEMQIIKSLPVSHFIQETLVKKLGKKRDSWLSKDIYKIRNSVEPNFIRVDADEVHYPLHIIHRFNIEHKIIEEDEKVDNLPELWNQEFSRVLGFDVDNDRNGCLQDIHWFSGDLGYFPTYSIGAFIAAQLANKVKINISDLNDNLKKGNFKPVIKWLKKNIHEKGSFYKIDDLLKNSTGEKLNLKYYENHIINRYLKEKF